jgi:hypothetical protein
MTFLSTQRRHGALAIALVCGAACAQAQTQAPGLWEHSITMNSPGGEAELAIAAAQQKLAALPPEQRQQIEQMMARNGVRISPGGTTTVRVCITKEAAARGTAVQLPGDCQQSGVVRKGNTMSFKFACTKPQPSSGEGEVSFISDKHYTGHSTINAQVAGRSQQLNVDLSGQWLAADCGDVKPKTAPTGQ